jgi:hypothetical protein
LFPLEEFEHANILNVGCGNSKLQE